MRVFLAGDLDRLAREWGSRLFAGAADAERERAVRLRDAVQSARFLASRRLLRLVLAHCSGKEPEQVVFSHGVNGKPHVAGLPFSFSLSRRERLAAIALSWGGEIGVDVEMRVSQQVCMELAERALTGAERRHLHDGPPEEMPDRFLRYWTLKEAILKASGEGLSREMREIELAIGPGGPAIVRLPAEYGDPRSWWIGLVATGLSGVCCALARH